MKSCYFKDKTIYNFLTLLDNLRENGISLSEIPRLTDETYAFDTLSASPSTTI